MPTFPLLPPPVCDDPCAALPECTPPDESVATRTAIGLAETLSVSPYKRVAFGLAAIFCKTSKG